MPAKRQSYRMQIDINLYQDVKKAAHNAGISMNEFIAQSLTVAVGYDENKPIVLGWVKLSRWGEVDDHDENGNIAISCPECGQDMDRSNCYVALLSNGQHYGPVCSACATSE